MMKGKRNKKKKDEEIRKEGKWGENFRHNLVTHAMGRNTFLCRLHLRLGSRSHLFHLHDNFGYETGILWKKIILPKKIRDQNELLFSFLGDLLRK